MQSTTSTTAERLHTSDAIISEVKHTDFEVNDRSPCNSHFEHKIKGRNVACRGNKNMTNFPRKRITGIKYIIGDELRNFETTIKHFGMVLCVIVVKMRSSLPRHGVSGPRLLPQGEGLLQGTVTGMCK